MKANKTEQKALIGLINRIYREIRLVEDEWHIRLEEGDFRPRIEYFHDAVREFTALGGEGTSGKGRLAVEMLAYDIEMLRYIQAHPVARTKAKLGRLSATVDVSHPLPRVAGDKTGLRMDPAVKHALADQYKSYGVIFAALLAPAAERNYRSRIEECNAEIEDLSALLDEVKGKGQIDLETAIDNNVQSPDLMNRILAAMHGGSLKKKMLAAEAERKFKEMMQASEKEHKSIDKAHFTYTTGQLAIYENSRDAIKKMAIKGFNIVGDFVANAVADAQRGQRER